MIQTASNLLNAGTENNDEINLMLLYTGFLISKPHYVMVAFLFRHKIYKYSSQNERNGFIQTQYMFTSADKGRSMLLEIKQRGEDNLVQ